MSEKSYTPESNTTETCHCKTLVLSLCRATSVTETVKQHFNNSNKREEKKRDIFQIISKRNMNPGIYKHNIKTLRKEATSFNE